MLEKLLSLLLSAFYEMFMRDSQRVFKSASEFIEVSLRDFLNKGDNERFSAQLFLIFVYQHLKFTDPRASQPNLSSLHFLGISIS